MEIPPISQGTTEGVPLVSVVLPVHDGEAFLAAAIKSILSQTMRDFELIVIDDGSNDGSARIAAGFADPRLRLIRNESNRGLVATLNEGLALARGRFVARMDADDVAEPQRLERQVARFLVDESLAALGTAIEYIDAAGRSVSVPPRQVQGPVMLRWRLLRGTCLYHPTMMVDRSRVGEDARYAPEFPHAEDYELFLRLSRRVDLDNLSEPLVKQRVHEGSVSARFRDTQRDSAARALVAHVRVVYGIEVRRAQAAALLDPRYFFGTACGDGDAPVTLLLDLERRFLRSEAGMPRDARAAVQRDVAFFLWKLVAIAFTDWSGKAWPLRRMRAVASCAWQLLLRPRAALATLVWR